MATYQPGIPTGSVPLDQDYLNVQGNFSQANVVYGTDHLAFDNASSNQGFHNQSSYPKQGAAPAGIAAGGRVFAQARAAVAGTIDLYYRYQNDGGTDLQNAIFPLTAVRAFGLATEAGLVVGTSFNVTSAPFDVPTHTWTINLTNHANADSTKIMVFATAVSATGNSGLGVTVTDTLTIKIIRSAADASQISFWVVAL